MDIRQTKGQILVGVAGIVLGATAAWAGGVKWPGHRHLQRGENMLIQAKTALNNATHDCGGHRVEAIKLIDQAIGEVRAARDWANAHPEDLKKR